MGLFDFLGGYAMNPTAGTSAIAASPTMGSFSPDTGLTMTPATAGTPGVAGSPGMTYGDIGAALMKYGSKPGSSGAMFAGNMPGQTSQPVGQLQDFGPTPQEKAKQQSATTMQSALKLASLIYPGLGSLLGGVK